MSLFFIGFGGFFGAISRYLVGVFINNIGLNTNISTLLVNIIGSFFMGLLFYIFSTNSSDFYKMFFVMIIENTEWEIIVGSIIVIDHVLVKHFASKEFGRSICILEIIQERLKHSL